MVNFIVMVEIYIMFNFFSKSNIIQMRIKHNEKLLEARYIQAKGDLNGYTLKILEADQVAMLISLAQIRINDN